MFGSFLSKKYDLLQQNANTAQYTAETGRQRADSQGNLENQQAAQIAPNAANARGLTAAQTSALNAGLPFIGQEAQAKIDLTKANTFNTTEEGKVRAPAAEAALGLVGAQTRVSNAAAGESEFNTKQLNAMTPEQLRQYFFNQRLGAPTGAGLTQPTFVNSLDRFGLGL